MSQHNTKENKKKFIEKFQDCGCNISKTAKAIGINRRTITRWMKEDREFAEDLQEEKEGQLDEVEDILMKKIRGFEHELSREKVDKDGNVIPYKSTLYFPPCFQSIQLKLNAYGRHRGYGMKPDDSDAGQHDNDE